MKQRHMILAAALACLLIGLLLWELAPVSRLTSGVSPVSLADPQGNRELVSTSDSGPLVDRDAVKPPDAGGLRIYVLSTDGRPLQGANISSHAKPPASTRSLPSAAFQHVATTGVRGYVDVDRAQRDVLAASLLVVDLDGYQVREAAVPVDPQVESIDIRLSAAVSLTVYCRTRDGRPLAGATIVASGAHVGAEEAASIASRQGQELPAGGTEAIHVARSDAEGRAHLGRMAPGKVFLGYHHESHVVVDGVPGDMVLVDADMQRDLIFDPVVCAVGLVVDDDVLAWMSTGDRNVLCGADIIDRLIVVDQKWRSSNGTVLCHVGVPAFLDGKYVDLPSHITFDVFTTGAGFSRVAVPLRLAVQWSNPEEIRLGNISRVEASAVSICLQGPSGVETDMLSGFQLRPLRDGRPGMLGIPLRDASPMILPNGRYAVATSQPLLLRTVTNQMVEVRGDGKLVIPLPFDATMCKLTWTDKHGLLVNSGRIAVIVGADTYEISVTANLSRCAWLLPIGDVNVSIKSAMGALGNQAVRVPSHRGVWLHSVGVVQ
jgi:hypothetical protein